MSNLVRTSPDLPNQTSTNEREGYSGTTVAAIGAAGAFFGVVVGATTGLILGVGTVLGYQHITREPEPEDPESQDAKVDELEKTLKNLPTDTSTHNANSKKAQKAVTELKSNLEKIHKEFGEINKKYPHLEPLFDEYLSAIKALETNAKGYLEGTQEVASFIEAVKSVLSKSIDFQKRLLAANQEKLLEANRYHSALTKIGLHENQLIGLLTRIANYVLGTHPSPVMDSSDDAINTIYRIQDVLDQIFNLSKADLKNDSTPN